jgi:hypothetical protein
MVIIPAKPKEDVFGLVVLIVVEEAVKLIPASLNALEILV